MSDTTDIRLCSAHRAPSLTKRFGALALATIAAGSVLVGSPRIAKAEEVSPDGKGIAGGALLGGELVVFIEALAGVRSGTAYLLGGLGGAVAGGVGGYAIEANVDSGRAPVYMLAGGLALVIPAIVVSLDATRYMPNEGAREDKPVQTLPPSDPGKPGGSSVVGAEAAGAASTPATPTPGATPNAGGTTPTPAPAPSTPAPAPAPSGGGGGGGGTKAPAMSLINLHEGAFRVGVPVPEVRQSLTAQERKQLGVQNAGSEVRFPVVRVTF